VRGTYDELMLESVADELRERDAALSRETASTFEQRSIRRDHHPFHSC